ncbi:MAG TPA: carbamoyltransferase [Prolixibacteraceae bacterium]|nr:carbamoyltransferase [Prolixibacteraceae bacterium]
MFILGISAFYHDSAACLLQDEVIVAAVQEERFTRIKNDSQFPSSSIEFCLQFAEIKLSDVDYVVFYEKPFLKFERIIETYVSFAPRGLSSFWKSMPLWIKEKLFQKNTIIQKLQLIDPLWKYDGENLLFTDHHQSHAASAFYPSPFNQAVILTLDGVGEWDTTTVALGSENNIEFLKEIKFPHSIGLLYSAFTYYLGFKVNCDEYKMMGLAPYGKPIFVDTICKHLIDVKGDGSFRLNMKYFDYGTGLRMTNHRFHTLFGAGPRQNSAEITGFHMDIACSIQKVTEDILLRMVNQLHRSYGYENLCLAGGVALNCVANGRILRESPFKNIWIQPAAGDAGGALGAAYAIYYKHLNNPRANPLGSDKMKNALLGPSFRKNQIETILRKNKLSFYKLDDELYFRKIAKEIANGKIIGWFDGRMEYGPRALGSRSILGDARNPSMQMTMNLKIKCRESFRPFAPAILEEFVNDYYDIKSPSPYMLLVDYLKNGHRIAVGPEGSNLAGIDLLKQVRSNVPAITHVDYSSRIQTVNSISNGNFYRLIKSFYELTGCPMIINTSFNRMDEPIVCSPDDAISCFLRSDIDILAIENFVVEKVIR